MTLQNIAILANIFLENGIMIGIQIKKTIAKQKVAISFTICKVLVVLVKYVSHFVQIAMNWSTLMINMIDIIRKKS